MNANVVPSTYKQKKTAVTAPKVDAEDDAEADAADAEAVDASYEDAAGVDKDVAEVVMVGNYVVDDESCWSGPETASQSHIRFLHRHYCHYLPSA